MDSLTDTIATTRRLLNLGEETTLEADYLIDHYRQHRAAADVFDEVSLLISASLRADREADILVAYGDDNDLARADVIAEEITRLLLRERDYRRFLDRRAGISRE